MTTIPADFKDMLAPMQAADTAIRTRLAELNLQIEAWPQTLTAGNPSGVAAARAYPMQGILKYHGMTDWDYRIAYLPTISLNSDAAETITLVEFDPALEEDMLFFNGERDTGRPFERVQNMLNVVRTLGDFSSCCKVTTRNITRANITGKGLGTSASGGAALATAALAAAFGSEIIENTRFVSAIARMLAGSACRSVAGGFALWLSYPGCAHEDSSAIRLDQHDELADVRLLTVPMPSRIGLHTEMAHRDAPESSFYKEWMRLRGDDVIECMDAVAKGDWETVAALAELDSIRLHGVTMSASRGHKIYGWEPENIALFRMCNDLREEGVPVYFSTDTGPTMVFITHKDHVDTVAARIQQVNSELEVVKGTVGGPSAVIDVDEARELLAA